MARENSFQAALIKDIEQRFEGSIVTKLDSGHIQGIPDLLVLYKDKWAALECKKSSNEKHQPNQDWYVEHMNTMSYASFVYPENKEKVLNEIEESFKPKRPARVPKSK
jgi:hypothetical protein